MTGAMYAAVSGLKTHMSAMNVIGNNISNVNTVGYKATRYTFNEALYTTVRAGSNGNDQLGGQNPAQIGYGNSIGTIDLDMSTKNYNPTGKAMDCMIDGDGFFIVGDDKTNAGITTQGQLNGMSLSRLGNFDFDAQGYLVDGNGSLVYGFLRVMSMDDAMAANGNNGANGTTEKPTEAQMTSPVLTPIRLPMCTIGANTDANADGTSNNVSPTKTTIYWPRYDAASGNLRDAQSGEGTIGGDAGGGGGQGDNVTLSRLQPNTVSVDKTGCITAMTKDEQLVVVGYIAIATVDSPNAVTHVDGRYYKALDGAGNAHLTTVGGGFTYIPSTEDNNNAGGNGDNALGSTNLTIETAGDTDIITGGLESSGTDLAQEITNMIVIQRGYQANTRIVSVTDSMLEELVNMKR